MIQLSKVILFGIGSFSLLLKEYLERFTHDSVVGFVCHRKYWQADKLDSTPVYVLEDLEQSCAPGDALILPSIGYSRMNTLRADVVNALRSKGYGFASFIHPSVQWYGDSIGEGNIILENVTFGLHSSLGDFNVVFNGCTITHDVRIGNCNHFSPRVAFSGNVQVGNYCFFGTNCTLKNNISIADYSLIGAGAFVQQSTQDHSVLVPARSITLENKDSMDVSI